MLKNKRSCTKLIGEGGRAHVEPRLLIFYKYFHGNAYNSLIFQYFFNPFFSVHCRGSYASFVRLESFIRLLVREIFLKENQFLAKNEFFHAIIKPPCLYYSFYGHDFYDYILRYFFGSDGSFEFALSSLLLLLWSKTWFLSRKLHNLI